MKLFLTMLFVVLTVAFNSVAPANGPCAQRNELVQSVSDYHFSTSTETITFDVTPVATMCVGLVVCKDDATPFVAMDLPYTGRDFSYEVDRFDNPSGFV